MLVFYFVFCIVFYIILYIVSPSLLSLSYFCTSLQTTDTGWKPNCSK